MFLGIIRSAGGASFVREVSMNNVNKTLYIPLYGKAYVSQKGIILKDTKAEEIWQAESMELKGKSKSKWLAYSMGMRSAIFDNWVQEKMKQEEKAIILHIGCGMDSRVERVGNKRHMWYDVDFPDVISERKRYYSENEQYSMIESDARKNDWILALPKDAKAIVIMEGVSMYFKLEELKKLLGDLQSNFQEISILMDCYTTFGARASKYKNPINEVGVTEVYGIDDPKILEEGTGISFVGEHSLTPDYLVNELTGAEKLFFKKVFAGKFAQRIYRLYEFKSVYRKEK